MSEPSLTKCVVTLGELLETEVRGLAARRLPSFEWLELLRPLIRRIQLRTEPVESRYRRREPFSAPARSPVKPLEPEEAAARQTEEPTLLPLPMARGIDPAGHLTARLTEEAIALPTGIQDRLRDLVGSEVAAMRVHRGPGSDRVARAQRAAAVTIGADVFLRTGGPTLEERSGIGLLAHEATHVVEAMRPGAAWRRATLPGLQAEEALAIGRERAVLGRQRRAVTSATEPGQTRGGPVTAPPPPTAGAPQARPMAADIDRPFFEAPMPPSTSTNGLDEMRRTLFRDLMKQIRVEFERGA